MNLGDGLLFELENGKPRLTLLSHGGARNSAKQLSFRPRASNVLSSRQPFCVEDVQEELPVRQHTGRHRESQQGVTAVTSFMSNTTTTGWRSTALTSSKTHDQNKGASVKTGAKVKSERQKYNTGGSQRHNGKMEQAQNRGSRGSGKAELKDRLASGDTESKDSMVCLTSEQLQQILIAVQTSSNDQHPAEDHRTHASGGDDLKSGSSMKGEGEKFQEDRAGGEEMKKGGGVTYTAGSLQDKDNRSSGGLFSWMEERQSDSRAAKKAQWKRELDEQVALKQQQRLAPARLQVDEDSQCVLSGLSSVSHREQPAAIRSSLRLGEVTPMEEVLSVERREEQRRRWLEELDRQREETAERRKQEKLLQSQTEDHELWATHFDSLQRRLPFQTAALLAPPAAPSTDSERGEREPSSSLSLVWEATSSCGAESVAGASVDTTSGNQTRARYSRRENDSYLRTMTALLDPVQIEEREKKRLKQLEQQRAIEAQVEERRRLREQEEVRRREEEVEEERRVAMEREMLQRQYELDSLRERQKEQLNHQAEQPKQSHDEQRLQETVEPSVTRQDECLEEEVRSSVSPYKDSAVQTEAAPCVPLEAERVQTPDVSAQYQPPQSLSAAPPNSKNRAGRTGKENICLPGRRGGAAGADPYEAFARTERSRRDKRRPEWNTHRPSCRFVPASERYPAALQRSRQESRLRRQAELLALQERTCLPRTDPPPTQNQEPRLCSNLTQTRTSPSRKVESVSRGQSISAAISTKREHSPPIPAVRHRVQGQQASTPPLPVLEFIPYVRTDEVFKLDPLEPTGTPPPHSHQHPAPQSSAPPPPSHRDPLLHPELVLNTRTHRQEEILRGLAQLRQGLLQKQRELETDLNPLLKHRM
ncbi:coiled-coil domain-containing protein 66 isoform X2 [Mastacembelus armatus]|uniref:coiled-coil domain-containing protein 66 isoform X2 n=1 Tax=Mastacembelus armatus TaxID=205130 RepID=UPI000E45AB7F|nr:coiled-coil domain-containing protein 66 isoform X2 [Mastacembelus armatus]